MRLEKYKEANIRFIQQYKYKYVIHLTFVMYNAKSKQIKYFIPEEVQRTSINFLLHLLNRKMFGPKYKEHDAYLKGFIFREKKELADNPHFHIIIEDDPVFTDTSKPSFETHLRKLLHIPRTPKNKKIYHPAGVLVEEVYAENGIIEYCNKRFKLDASHMGILSINGVV
jgi:hypothetical protein